MDALATEIRHGTELQHEIYISFPNGLEKYLFTDLPTDSKKAKARKRVLRRQYHIAK